MNTSTYIKITLCIICVSLSYLYYYFWVPTEIHCIRQANTNYTYIIVGAGTSGCVLAARLSENHHNQVLLIEAGGHFNILSKVPFLAVFLQKSYYDWEYESEPQKWSSLGFYDRIQFLPRGKGLGGSNQLNLLIYNGFSNESTWELHDSLLHYIRSKKCSKQSQYLEYIFSLNSNKCKVKCKNSLRFRVQRSKSELSDILKQSLEELNYTMFKYFKGDTAIYEGERWSTYRSHLLPAAGRKNLHIMCNTEVNKIIFKDKQAIGVQLSNNQEIYTKSEIIVSAGSINTPRILLASGIGNKRYMQEFNITTVQNLPGVGENLHDHIAMPIYVEIQKPLSLTLSKVLNAREVFNYLFKRKGNQVQPKPLTEIHFEGVFGASPVAAYLQSAKNFLVLFMGSTPEDPFRRVANYMPETFRSLFPFANDHNHEGFVFLAGCKDTQSRGSVRITSQKTVTIDPRYFQKREDVTCVKNAMKVAFQLLNTTHFKRIGAKMHLPQLTQCVGNLTSDAYLECIIQVAAITTYHQAGTCKMGNDSLSVVDTNFRVKGVGRLRIVDGSVLPIPSNNFPNTVITVMAEYASSLLN